MQVKRVGNQWIVVILLGGSFAWLTPREIRAAESLPTPGTELPAPAVTPTPTAPPQTPKKTEKKSKGKRIREKETEGSEALDRFEADTVIKSKYNVNGESLEVDPD